MTGGLPKGSGVGRQCHMGDPACQLSSWVAEDGAGSHGSLGRDLSSVLDFIAYHQLGESTQ